MRIFGFLYCMLFLACNSPSELELSNGCGADLPSDVVQKTDFKKNFRIKIPENWNTSHFYSPATSEMFVADTTKVLTESYIMQLIYHDAEITMGSSLNSKIVAFNQANHYSLVDSNQLQFKNHPATFFTLHGKKNNFDVLIFDLYVKISETSYFNSKTEIYGNERIQERLCESLAILNSLDFVK